MHNRTDSRLFRTMTLLAATTLVGAGIANGGPLNPPPGPISPTGKTIGEVEPRIAITSVPFTINVGGSYYLASSFTNNNASADSITIVASNVTLDLNGFTLTGGRTGVYLSTGVADVVIRNGNIRTPAGSGIFADAVFGTRGENVTVKDVKLTGTRDAGVFVGDRATIERVTIRGDRTSPSSSGITVGRGSLVSRCTVDNVSLASYTIGDSSQIADSIATGGGADGFRLGAGTMAVRCVARSLSGSGFVLTSDGVLQESLAMVCSAGGALVQPNSSNFRIDRSTFTVQSPGIVVGTGSLMGLIRDNLVRSTGGTSVGILVSAGTEDIEITGNTIGRVNRAVVLDGRFSLVTRNTIQSASVIAVNGAGAPPDASNFVGPIISSQAGVDTATNPLANLYR